MNCYAEKGSKRNLTVLGRWGTEAQGGTRIVASEDGPNGWRAPELWQERRAQESRNNVAPIAPHYVFPSWCDPFEDWPGRMTSHKGNPLWMCGGSMSNSPLGGEPTPPGFTRWVTMDDIRERLFQLIEDTPLLTWLLLTKRPENVRRMMPPHWLESGPPRNLWLGTSVETQRDAVRRILELARCPAVVRFLSVEPQLEEINLGLAGTLPRDVTGGGYVLTCDRIHWVICGGESGANARPFFVGWARALRDECKRAGVKFFMKQLGDRCMDTHTCETAAGCHPVELRAPKGGDPSEWPADLRVREMPDPDDPTGPPASDDCGIPQPAA